MTIFSGQRHRSVSEAGAAAGAVLAGSSASNKGMRLRVVEAQPCGGGPITGGFVILDAGDNRHTGALLPMVGRDTDAAEVTAAIRRDSPMCVSVANANILVREPT